MGSEDNEQIRQSLRENFLFAPLSEADLGDLAAHLWLETIPAGSLIVRENESADALFMVLSGGVNVTKANGQFLAFLGPGGFFGEMALFIEGSARTANCAAVSDTTCVIVRKDVLDRFCHSHPESGLKIYAVIIRTLAERLQATSSDLAILMGSQVRSQSSVSKLVEEARNRIKP